MRKQKGGQAPAFKTANLSVMPPHAKITPRPTEKSLPIIGEIYDRILEKYTDEEKSPIEMLKTILEHVLNESDESDDWVESAISTFLIAVLLFVSTYNVEIDIDQVEVTPGLKGTSGGQKGGGAITTFLIQFFGINKKYTNKVIPLSSTQQIPIPHQAWPNPGSYQFPPYIYESLPSQQPNQQPYHTPEYYGVASAYLHKIEETQTGLLDDFYTYDNVYTYEQQYEAMALPNMPELCTYVVPTQNIDINIINNSRPSTSRAAHEQSQPQPQEQLQSIKQNLQLELPNFPLPRAHLQAQVPRTELPEISDDIIWYIFNITFKKAAYAIIKTKNNPDVNAIESLLACVKLITSVKQANDMYKTLQIDVRNQEKVLNITEKVAIVKHSLNNKKIADVRSAIQKYVQVHEVDLMRTIQVQKFELEKWINWPIQDLDRSNAKAETFRSNVLKILQGVGEIKKKIGNFTKPMANLFKIIQNIQAFFITLDDYFEYIKYIFTQTELSKNHPLFSLITEINHIVRIKFTSYTSNALGVAVILNGIANSFCIPISKLNVNQFLTSMNTNDVKNNIIKLIIDKYYYDFRRGEIAMSFHIMKNRISNAPYHDFDPDLAVYKNDEECKTNFDTLIHAIEYAGTRKDIIKHVSVDYEKYQKGQYTCCQGKIIKSRVLTQVQGGNKAVVKVKVLGRIRKVLTGSRGGQYVLVKNARISLKNAIKMDNQIKINAQRTTHDTRHNAMRLNGILT